MFRERISALQVCSVYLEPLPPRSPLRATQNETPSYAPVNCICSPRAAVRAVSTVMPLARTPSEHPPVCEWPGLLPPGPCRLRSGFQQIMERLLVKALPPTLPGVLESLWVVWWCVREWYASESDLCTRTHALEVGGSIQGLAASR